MIKLYGMTLLALVCASSISVDANHSYYKHGEHPYYKNGGTGEEPPETAGTVESPLSMKLTLA